MNTLKADIFETIALCFAPCDEALWAETTSFSSWRKFLEACEGQLKRRDSFDETWSEVLAAHEIEAMENPPDFAQKRSFAARHFTGGLPASAMPIESLYGKADSFTGEVGYGGPSAAYMQHLLTSMGIDTPHVFKKYPDHLALECDLAALLYRDDPHVAARFVSERFDWLNAFRMKLVLLNDQQRCFYCALVDVVLAIAEAETYAAQEALSEMKLERK